MTSNQIAWHRMIEERRSNLANEQERSRSNKEHESISWYDALERNRSNLETEALNQARFQFEQSKRGWDVLGDLANGALKLFTIF